MDMKNAKVAVEETIVCASELTYPREPGPFLFRECKRRSVSVSEFIPIIGYEHWFSGEGQNRRENDQDSKVISTSEGIFHQRQGRYKGQQRHP